VTATHESRHAVQFRGVAREFVRACEACPTPLDRAGRNPPRPTGLRRFTITVLRLASTPRGRKPYAATAPAGTARVRVPSRRCTTKALSTSPPCDPVCTIRAPAAQHAKVDEQRSEDGGTSVVGWGAGWATGAGAEALAVGGGPVAVMSGDGCLVAHAGGTRRRGPSRLGGEGPPAKHPLPPHSHGRRLRCRVRAMGAAAPPETACRGSMCDLQTTRAASTKGDVSGGEGWLEAAVWVLCFRFPRMYSVLLSASELNINCPSGVCAHRVCPGGTFYT
jgi:hypothetical protein